MVNCLEKTQPTLPCHEYTLPLLFRGWGKTGPSHSFPTLTRLNINIMQKVITWGKTVVHTVNGVGKSSANLILPRIRIKLKFLLGGGEKLLCIWLKRVGKSSANLTQPRIRIKPKVLVRGWGKTGPAHSFPTLTRLNINLVEKVIGWGKTVVHMVNHLRKTQPTLPCHEYTCNLGF